MKIIGFLLVLLILITGCVSKGTYTELKEEKEKLEQKNTELNEINLNLSEDILELETSVADYKILENDLSVKIETYEKSLIELTSNLDLSKNRVSDLILTKSKLEEKISEYQNELTEVNNELDLLESDYISAALTLATLQSELNQIPDLEAKLLLLRKQKSDLESSINELLKQQKSIKPFIPDTFKNTFACTGSMNPAITCMDEAIWLRNYKVEDIVIGSVISFDTSSLGCRISSSSVAHRVISINKSSNGQLTFLTKGDNNSKTDGCWIPEDNIHYYMVDLIKHSYPDMEVIYTVLWPKEVRFKQLTLELDNLNIAIDSAENSYNNLLQSYCNKEGPTWYCSSNGLQIVEQARLSLNSMINEYNFKRIERCNLYNQIESHRRDLQELRDNYYGDSLPTKINIPWLCI